MKQAGWIRTTYLTRFSQPVQDRVIYQTLYHHPVTSVLEIGMGSGTRTGRMLELILAKTTPDCLRYTGIDLFEARKPSEPKLTLKQAHQLLAGHAISHRLLPGDPLMALSRAANTITPVDLVVVSADQDADSMQRAWFYVPRLLHANSIVLMEQPKGAAFTGFQLVGIEEVRARADAANPNRRRAA